MRTALIHAKRRLYSLRYALKIGSSDCFFVHCLKAPISRQTCSPLGTGLSQYSALTRPVCGNHRPQFLQRRSVGRIVGIIPCCLCLRLPSRARGGSNQFAGGYDFSTGGFILHSLKFSSSQFNWGTLLLKMSLNCCGKLAVRCVFFAQKWSLKFGHPSENYYRDKKVFPGARKSHVYLPDTSKDIFL